LRMSCRWRYGAHLNYGWVVRETECHVVATVQSSSATLLRHNQIFVVYFAQARLPLPSRLLDVVAADGVKANLTRQGVYLLW